jgi:phenol 2-monooxygenase (NADPH)
MANARCAWAYTIRDIADVSSDLHKTFIDDESYNSGHGKAYEFYGVDPREGAVAIVRPDQCTCASPFKSKCANASPDVSMVTAIDNYEAIGDFFKGFALPRV